MSASEAAECGIGANSSSVGAAAASTAAAADASNRLHSSSSSSSVAASPQLAVSEHVSSEEAAAARRGSSSSSSCSYSEKGGTDETTCIGVTTTLSSCPAANADANNVAENGSGRSSSSTAGLRPQSLVSTSVGSVAAAVGPNGRSRSENSASLGQHKEDLVRRARNTLSAGKTRFCNFVLFAKIDLSKGSKRFVSTK